MGGCGELALREHPHGPGPVPGTECARAFHSRDPVCHPASEVAEAWRNCSGGTAGKWNWSLSPCGPIPRPQTHSFSMLQVLPEEQGEVAPRCLGEPGGLSGWPKGVGSASSDHTMSWSRFLSWTFHQRELALPFPVARPLKSFYQSPIWLPPGWQCCGDCGGHVNQCPFP